MSLISMVKFDTRGGEALSWMIKPGKYEGCPGVEITVDVNNEVRNDEMPYSLSELDAAILVAAIEKAVEISKENKR